MSDAGQSNVLIQTAFLGDLLLAIPLMKKMKNLWPEDPLILVCRKGLGDFFRQVGLVDRVIEISKGNRGSYAEAVRQLRQERIGQIVSPHTSFRTAFLVGQLKAKHKISFKTWWNGLFFGRRYQRDVNLPDALRQLSLLCQDDGNLEENLRQYLRSGRAYRMEDQRLSGVPLWAKMSLRERLISDKDSWVKLMTKVGWGRYEAQTKVLIFPGSVWATKRWTEEGFVHIGRELQQTGCQIFVMGAGNEVEIAQRVSEQIPGAVSLAGVTSLYESALLLCHSDLMIGNDSASIHLASACETPLVSIFGPTVLEFGFRPWSDHAYVAEKKTLTCRPCGPHGHHRCPRGTHECMKDVAPGEVLAIARRALGGG